MRDMPDQESALDHLNSVIAARGRGGVFSVALDLGQDSSHVSKWRNRRRPIPPHLINRIMALSGDLRAGTGPDGPNLPDTGPRGPDGPQNGHKGHHSAPTHPDTGPNGQNDGQMTARMARTLARMARILARWPRRAASNNSKPP
ncbi:hypothetical protein [Tateyamaria sp.]|uniref:hypothetical protein n=1 Tax=Tateyamaria sp. TaxID=1929288 RepID=UPI003B22567C